MRTALLLDARFAGHDGEPGHPESPARITRLLPLLDDPGRPGMVRVDARPATDAELLAVHAPSHLARIAATEGTRTRFDADTTAGPQTYRTALLASGGVIETVNAVLDGAADNGLALVRPPGHHAGPDRAMGFCFLNHVAVAAAHLRRRGLARVAIVDWDAHHGNGTQDAFEADGSVLYASMHEFPFYPGTGAANERGTGDGTGATLNVPLRAGDGDAAMLSALDDVVLPAVREFAPEFVLVSAGFDPHARDPLARLRASTEVFPAMTRRLRAAARELCGGRLVLVLEGGYDLDALDGGVRAVWRELGREEDAA